MSLYRSYIGLTRRFDRASDGMRRMGITVLRRYRPLRNPAVRSGRVLLLGALVLPPVFGITQSIPNSRVGYSLLCLTLAFVLVIGWAAIDRLEEAFLLAAVLVLALVISTTVAPESPLLAPLIYAPLVPSLLGPRATRSWIGRLMMGCGAFEGWYASGLFHQWWGITAALAVVISLATMVALWGYRVNIATSEARRDFGRTWHYLAAMRGVTVLLAIVYAGVVMIFAGWYQLLYHELSTGSFTGTSNSPTYWDFVYFSIMTISTVGYSSIRPADSIAQIVTSLEVVMGITLTVVVFAALVSYFSPKFAAVARRLRTDDALETLGALELAYAEGSAAERDRALKILDKIKQMVLSSGFAPEGADDKASDSAVWLGHLAIHERRRAASLFQDAIDEWEL